MPVRSLFTTLFYEERIADAPLLDGLERSCRTLAAEDKAGRSWSRANNYPGYTSYASLNDLPTRASVFGKFFS